MGLKKWFKFQQPEFSLALNRRPFSSMGVLPQITYVKYFSLHAIIVIGLVYGIMAQSLMPGFVFWLCSALILFSSSVVYIQEIKRLRDIFGKDLSAKYFYISLLCIFPFIGLGLFLALATVPGRVSANNEKAPLHFKACFVLMTTASVLLSVFLSNSLSRKLDFELNKKTAFEVSKRLIYNNANVTAKFVFTTGHEVLRSFVLSDQELWKTCLKQKQDPEACLNENFEHIDQMQFGTTGQVISSAGLLKQMYQDVKTPRRGLASKGPLSYEQLRLMAGVSTLTVHSAERIKEVQPLFKRIDGAVFNLIFGGAQELILLDLIMELNRKEMFLIFKERALALTQTALEKLKMQGPTFQERPEVQKIAEQLETQQMTIEQLKY